MNNTTANNTKKTAKQIADEKAIFRFKQEQLKFYNVTAQKELTAEQKKEFDAKVLAFKANLVKADDNNKKDDSKKDNSNKNSKKGNSKKDSKKEKAEKIDYSAIKATTIDAIKTELGKAKKLIATVDKFTFTASANDDNTKHRFYVKAEGSKNIVRVQYTKNSYNVVANVDFTLATKTEQAHPYRATKLTEAQMKKAVVSAFAKEKQNDSKKQQKTANKEASK